MLVDAFLAYVTDPVLGEASKMILDGCAEALISVHQIHILIDALAQRQPMIR